MLFKISAAVLAIAVILAIDLFKAPETMHARTNFLVLRNKNGDLLKLTPVTVGLNLHQWSGYNLMEKIWLFNGYKGDKQIASDKVEVFNELVTATFLKWLAHHYHLHWEMEHNYVYGISGGGGHAFQKEGRDDKTGTYCLRDSANGFLVDDRVFNEIKMPERSSASLLTETGLTSSFTIQNPHAIFTFKMLYLGNSGVSYSILGDKLDAHLLIPDQFYAHDYILTLDAAFSRRLRWSPGTKKQKEWIKQIFSNFERDFNWDVFKPQLEAALDGLPIDTKMEGIPLRYTEAKMKDDE